MYSRAPRNVGDTFGSTPQHIGPGTYDVVGFDLKKQSLDSYAPFLSLSLREDVYGNVNETPGPGQYNVRANLFSIKGGSTLANKSKRFDDKKEEIPGPGTYAVENKENKAQIPIELRISKQRVKFSRKKNAPSIQDPKCAYGFEEAANGELIAQTAPERDPTLGPAYYNASFNYRESQYKGIHFGKYSSKRTDFGGKKTGPGPGEYDTIEPVHVDVEHYHMKNFTDKKPELNVPRYPENLIKTVEKESVPPPTKYEQKRLFDDVSSKQSDIFGIETERPPFGVQAKRFDNQKSIAPGPGAYNEQRTAFTSLQKVHGLKKTPFSQSSVRFEMDNVYKVRSAPGPGQYRLNGFAEDNLRKAIIESRRKPAFGQTEPRKFNLAKKDEYNTPGPAQYLIKEKPFKPKKENFSSNFASSTKQFEFHVEDTPGPTAYNVPKAYDYLIHTRREAPRNKNALKRQESFNVVARRNFNLAKNEEVPGPGAYDQSLIKSKTNIAKQTDARWKGNINELPGPADYELSPMFQDTVLKGTFNATLNNPLVLKRQQKSVSDSNLTDRRELSRQHLEQVHEQPLQIA